MNRDDLLERTVISQLANGLIKPCYEGLCDFIHCAVVRCLTFIPLFVPITVCGFCVLALYSSTIRSRHLPSTDFSTMSGKAARVAKQRQQVDQVEDHRTEADAKPAPSKRKKASQTFDIGAKRPKTDTQRFVNLLLSGC